MVTLAEVLVLFHPDHCPSELMNHSSVRAGSERLFPKVMPFSELEDIR